MKLPRIWRRPELGLSGRYLALEIVAWGSACLGCGLFTVKIGGLVRIASAAYIVWVAAPNLALCLWLMVRHRRQLGQ